MTKRAQFLEWKLVTPADQARARRSYQRALQLLAVVPGDTGDLARLARRETSLLRIPPLRALWRWLAVSRWRRIAFAFGVIASIALAGIWSFRVELGVVKNLARGRAWQTSSSYGGSATSGRLAQPNGEPFFHTAADPSPSILLDLGASQNFSRIRLVNRRDCCQSRAVPLLVEASDDQRHWRTLLRRETPFNSLYASLPPVKARFVRLRVDRKSYLHLVDIGLYRW